MRFLVYRELIRSRKAVMFGYFGAMAGGILLILVALSFRVGNLAMLPSDIREGFDKINNGASLPMLAILSGISMSSSASSDTEGFGLWRMFRRSTPVSPLKFAAAKYITLFIYLIISSVSALILSVLFCAAAEIPLTLEVCAVMAACVEATLLFSAAMTVIQAAFRSSGDKAGLILTAALVVPFSVIGTFLTVNEIDPGITPESVTGFCVDILPFSPIMIAVIFAAAIFLTAAAYKRREK